jgi:hypothetical protein
LEPLDRVGQWGRCQGVISLGDRLCGREKKKQQDKSFHTGCKIEKLILKRIIFGYLLAIRFVVNIEPK